MQGSHVRTVALFFVASLTLATRAYALDTFDFSAATFTAAEGGVMLVTVTRTSDNGGANPVSVDFAATESAPVSATAGTDFLVTNGTLNWAVGDLTPKTFNVQIAADAVREPTETFSLALSNPQDPAAGAALGNRSVATGQIFDSLASLPGLTPNQASLAQYLDNVCPRLAQAGAQTPAQTQILRACNGINDAGTTPKQVTTALDAINPEELTVAATTALRITSMQNGNLMQRLDALRSGASGIDLAGLNLQIGSQHVAGAALTEIYKTTAEAVTGKPVGGGASADDWSPWGLFANGNVKVGQQDHTDNAAAFDYNSIGVTAGVDYRFAQNFVLGIGLGYTSVSSDYDHAGGNLDIDAWSGSLFGTYFVRDSFYLDGMLTYGSNSYSTQRNIRYTDFLGTIDEKANGDTDGLQLSGGLSGGFDFNHGPWTFGPHFGANYTDAGADSFKEKGAGGYDMAVGDQHAQSFQLNGGVHLSFVHNTKWGVLIPHVRVDYVHELQDSAEVVAVRFANDPFATDPLDPTPHVHLTGDRPDSDYVVWSVGASAQFINGISGFVNYRSLAGFDDFTMNEFTFGVRMEKSF